MINLLNKLVLDKKKVFLIIPVCLIVIYIDIAFIFRAQFKGIETLSPKIINLKKDIGALAKDLLMMQDLKNKQVQTKEGIWKTKKVILGDEVPLLLQDISGIANKDNVKIIKISPSKELNVKEASVSQEGKINLRLITLDLSCGYHYLGKFINDLENTKAFITVEEMRIIPDPNNYFQQNVSLVLKVYVKK